MRLQARFLRREGHEVTIVAPRRHGRAALRAGDHPELASSFVDLPSVPITLDREYGASWPGRRTDRRLDAAMRARPPVDVVHVQGDFWGAFLGLRFAARHRLPVVLTLHNNVEAGIRAVAPLPGLVLRVLNAWQRAALRPLPGTRPRGASGGAYLRGLASRADAVVAPSAHFARLLEAAGVRGATVVRTGVDDDEVAALAREGRRARGGDPVTLVWLGRFSAEKRPLEFLDAVGRAGGRARVRLLGSGLQEARARRLVAERGLGDRVRFEGGVPYPRALRAIAEADALVQTSIGFETQGMTVFEALALGTPVVVSDPEIAEELGAGWGWPVAGPTVGDLAEALALAVREIESGAAPALDEAARAAYLQSTQTRAMIRLYERVLAPSQAGRGGETGA